ncbi:MAG: hypothetical protein U1F10_05365 [Burkholderiales bacterium]
MNGWEDALADASLQWQMTLGAIGWHHLVFAVGYAAAGTLCCVSAAVAQRDGGHGQAWYAAAVLLVLLGVNSMVRFDLLALFLVRTVARAQDWYGQRRGIQAGVLALVAVAAGAVLVAGRTHVRAFWQRCELVAAGLALLVTLAVVRAISLHYTDRALDTHVAGASVGRLLEFAGLGLTAAGALRWSRGA